MSDQEHIQALIYELQMARKYRAYDVKSYAFALRRALSFRRR